MGNIPKTFDDYRFAAVSAIIPVVHLDMALRKLGANPRRPPTLYAGPLPDVLSWGVDSAVSAARLLFSGQTLGAAAMIRNQLERWMSQRAASLSLSQRTGESTVAFFARTWSHPDALHDQWYETHQKVAVDLFDEEANDPPIEAIPDWVHNAVSESERVDDHLHVYRSDGTDVCPALIYALLSDFLHLRAFDGASRWDAELLAPDDSLLKDVIFAASAISDAIFLALREIRLVAIKMAKRQGLESTVGLLSTGMDAISMSDTHTDLDYEAIPFGSGRTRETQIPPVATLAPLLPKEGLAPGVVATVRSLSRDYDAVLRKVQRPAGRLYEDDELFVRSFAWHRQRSITVAIESLEREREALGSEFNLDSLTGRSTKWILLTETAGLLALWHPVRGVQIAASALASSLRSAYWIWLEDDDRAMAILRSSLEYVARLRTWRRKPSKAQSLDARSQTTPRDWITHAGWNRLHLLNRILGEFSHARKMEDWPAARQLLAELQIDVDSDKAIYTARGAAIDFIASLAVREVVALLSDVSANVAAGAGRILEGMGYELDEDAVDVEAQFAHIWSVRSQFSTQ